MKDLGLVEIGPTALDFFEHLADEHSVDVVIVHLRNVPGWQVELSVPKLGDWGSDLVLKGRGPTLPHAVEAALKPLERQNRENTPESATHGGN